jgi:hypothetical protein
VSAGLLAAAIAGQHPSMNFRISIAAGFVVSVLATGHALAAGGLLCSQVEGATKLDIQAGVARDVGSPLFAIKATVIRDGQGAPIVFGHEDERQFWFDEKDLRLMLYREAAAEGTQAQLIVETSFVSQDDESRTYEGSFRLTVFQDSSQPMNWDGKISCMAD